MRSDTKVEIYLTLEFLVEAPKKNRMWPYISHNPAFATALSGRIVSYVAARTEDLRGDESPREGEMLVTGPPGTDSRRSEHEAADSVTRQVGDPIVSRT